MKSTQHLFRACQSIPVGNQFIFSPAAAPLAYQRSQTTLPCYKRMYREHCVSDILKRKRKPAKNVWENKKFIAKKEYYRLSAKYYLYSHGCYISLYAAHRDIFC